MRLSWIVCALALLGSIAAGCGGGSRAAYQGGGGGYATASVATEGSHGGDEGEWGGAAGGGASAGAPAEPAAPPGTNDFVEEEVAGELRREPQRYAQADTRGRTTTASTGTTTPPQTQAQETATDAVDTSGPLLVYTATFHLAVYEVRESQERIVAAARELGGFVFAQSDDRLVVRIPAPRFLAMIEHVEQAGDVEHRDVQAQDVSEEFHDVEIRIRNLEAMRTRVEALLAQARTVEEALEVEQQLQRITQELELLRGRQRFLADRVAFSTITVLFRPRPREVLDQPEVFELPFGWLDALGLSNLLDLRS